jgi:hypothetical protein
VGLAPNVQIFTVSMNFIKKNKPILSTAEFARGYLDDSLIISFGILDTTSHYVEVTVQDILMDHVLCADVLEAPDA